MKVRIPRNARLARFLLGPVGRVLLVSCALLVIAGGAVFSYYYVKYSRLIDQKLRAGPFQQTSKIFAAPRTVWVGDALSPADVIAELRRAGYSDSRGNPMGYFHLRADAVEIFPGPDSFYDQNEPGVIKFAGNRISQIVALADNTTRSQFQLEPQLITNLFDRNREKRRLIRFADVAPVLVDAITAAEDKRFFQHAGFDPIRIARTLYVDLTENRRYGASTLSMQLARGLWLDQEKTWARKLAEAVITLQLEQRLSKQEIFEYYANHVFLGWRGGFRIHGFGEAAEVYFGKDIRQLTLPQAATLAGLIQRPSDYNPFRHPDRALERRNIVLGLMRQNGQISERDYAVAAASPIDVARGASASVEAPYFVDLVNDTLQNQFQELDFQASSYRVYTSLDMDLQRAAMEAVRLGTPAIDEQIKRQRRFRGKPIPDAQVALVAIDPRTGQIKALIGGRNYGVSQLNRALAKRQPGSVFKPFVFAAALDTALEGGPRILTAGTTLVDQPTTFWYDGKPYEPGNFKHEFHGAVTLRQALAKSINVATVKVAEMVGYDRVVDVARRAGLNYKINPTPAVALGAYEVTPIEMAGAYTIFANGGVFIKPNFISMVRSSSGKPIFVNKVEKQQALDPRVAYLMTNLMEEVMRSGTGAGVRARGFKAPAAGKTGTSHDGWFAGYTTELICAVWVGFDDNRELNLEGAHSALPIWTEFMKRALEYRQYRNAQPFRAPDGIVTLDIDPATGMQATGNCPIRRPEVYIAGSQPVGFCPLHGGSRGVTNVAGWETTPQMEPPPAMAPVSPRASPAVTAQRGLSAPSAPVAATELETGKPKEKKGILRRIWGVFK